MYLCMCVKFVPCHIRFTVWGCSLLEDVQSTAGKPSVSATGKTYIHDGRRTYSQGVYMRSVCKDVLTFPPAMLAGPLPA